MAFLQNPMDEEEGQLALTGGQQTGGTGGAFLAGSGATGAGDAAQPKQGGTNWVNLSRYIDANKGAGAQLANTLTDTAGKKIGEAETGIKNFQNYGEGEINAGTTQVNNPLIEQIKNDPSKVSKHAFKTSTTGYQGPGAVAGLSGYGDVKKASEDASKIRQQIQDQATQKVILEDTFKGRQRTAPYDAGNYTTGMSNLDSFIVQAEPTAAPVLKSFQDQTSGFDSKFGSAEKLLGDYLSNARDTSERNARTNFSAVGDTRSGILAGIRGDLGNRESRLKGEAEAASAGARADIDARLGLPADAADRPNAGSYIRRSGIDPISVNQAMTADELARLRALAYLDDSEGPSDIESNPFSFDAGGYENDVMNYLAAKRAEEERNRLAAAEEEKKIPFVEAAQPGREAIGDSIVDTTPGVNNAPPVADPLELPSWQKIVESIKAGNAAMNPGGAMSRAATSGPIQNPITRIHRSLF